MTISSRTPEGSPHRCPVCGNTSLTEPSHPSGDSCCASCGQLLWWFRDHLNKTTDILPETVRLSMPFTDVGLDSLDDVELVMELEEEFGITIPDEVAERINTVKDAIRYIEQQRRN